MKAQSLLTLVPRLGGSHGHMTVTELSRNLCHFLHVKQVFLFCRTYRLSVCVLLNISALHWYLATYLTWSVWSTLAVTSLVLKAGALLGVGGFSVISTLAEGIHSLYLWQENHSCVTCTWSWKVRACILLIGYSFPLNCCAILFNVLDWSCVFLMSHLIIEFIYIFFKTFNKCPVEHSAYVKSLSE